MKRSVLIIGGGPAALMLAAQLDENKFQVRILEKNQAPGRKFLVAGDGGFNLTHSEAPDQFIERYTPNDFLRKAFTSFNNSDLREWLKKIGIETFVGSSKRIFPIKGIKPIDVLNAILEELKRKNVEIACNSNWVGWSDNILLFGNGDHINIPRSAIVVFALGGASWKVTGSDGSWTRLFEEKGIRINPFYPSNCTYLVRWPQQVLDEAEGKSLKNISIRCGEMTKNGELVITKTGIEGGAIYALSPAIRKQLTEKGSTVVSIDLKPSLNEQQIEERFIARGNRSIKKMLVDKLNLDDTKITLLKSMLSKEEFTDPETLIARIKSFPITITAPGPIDEAISTVGGIAPEEIDEHFQLKKLPGHYCIGEMLDWDAPTGGYLLQACFSMGHALARHLNEK